MRPLAVTTAASSDPRRDPRRRPARVLALLAAVVLLSLGDLWMTLTHLRTVGMFEANPLAREVINLNSPLALAAWKLATVALAVGILFRLRARRAGEAGAWVCVAVLTWLTVHWVRYSDELSSPGAAEAVDTARRDPRWVVLGSDAP